MLIAGIAEELTADDPAALSDGESPSRLSLEKAVASAGPPPPMAHRTLQIPVPSPRASERGDILDPASGRATIPRWLWVAGAAAVALLATGVLALAIGPSEDSIADRGDARSKAPDEPEHELAQHETMRPTSLATAAVRISPATPASDTPGVRDHEALVPPPLPEIPQELAPEDTAPPAEESAGERASPAANLAPTEASKSGSASPRSNKRARRAGGRSAATTPPPPSTASPTAPASPPPTSPADLLQEARQALKQGDASTAYRLAFRSNGKKRSRSALQLMAKAACRMKSRDKAKAAFDQLPLGDRSGLRSECRGYGVRLGL